MEVKWVDGFEIRVTVDSGAAVISANREGLLSLAKHLTALADSEPGEHIHYDEYNSLNMECFYKWDAENRLASFSGSVNGRYCKGRCFYDKQNRMVKVVAVDSVGNKSTVRYKYDKSNRLVEESYVSNNPRYKYSKVRKFDKKDRLVLEKTYDDGKWKIESFVYDDEKQTMVNKIGDKRNMVVAYKRSFDKYGNWTKWWDDSNFVRYRNIVYRK